MHHTSSVEIGSAEPGADSLPDVDTERFMADTQAEIQRLLDSSNLKQIELSRRLGVSEQRVSQMFRGKGRNLTMSTVAKIFHSLGERPVLITEAELRKLAEPPGSDPQGRS